MTSLVRAAFLAATLAACATARTDVRYTFDSAFGAFSLVVKAPLTKATIVPFAQLKTSRGYMGAKVTSVEFQPGRSGSDTLVIVQGGDRYAFVFKPGAFTAYGSRKSYVGIEGTLSLAKVAIAAKRP